MREQYFRTWVGYTIPVVPDQPVDYADTADDTAIYRAEFDADNHLATFEKRLRTRSSGPEITALGEPGRKLFLRAQGSDHQPGREIEYSDTRELDSYYEAVLLDGDRARTTLVLQPIVMTDQYLYDRGTLVGRIVRNEDGRVRRMAVVDGNLVSTN